MACKKLKVSLDDVLPRYDLTVEQLDTPCSFEHCHEVSRHLVLWEPLAPLIALNEVDITTIQRDHPRDYRSQCSAALTKWRHKLGRRATFLRLVQSLETVESIDVVEKVCQIALKSSVATTPAGGDVDPASTMTSGEYVKAGLGSIPIGMLNWERAWS